MDQHGVSPADITDLESFIERFPTTDVAHYKQVAIADEKNVLAASHLEQPYHEDRSSGSTGIPTTVRRTSAERNHNNAKTLAHLFRRGLRPWHRLAAIVPPCQVVERDSFLQRLGVFRRITIDHYMPLEEATEAIIQKKIDAIYGRKAGIQLLAPLIAKHPDFRPYAFMMPGAEVINRADRKYLCEQYRPRNYAEMYGCTETGIIATRKDDDDYAIDYNSVFVTIEDVETLDSVNGIEGNFHRGTVVVSSLYNWLQPFLKYKLDDIAIVRNLDLANQLGMTIVDIEGRSDDFLLLPDGKQMSAATFKCIIENFDSVWQYKVVQDQVESCQVQVVLNDEASNERALITEAIQELVAGKIDCEVCFVDEIKPGANGKFKMLESSVSRQHGL
ncbi:MAG: hypothetical protein MK161_16475 [Pirellulales bacterium]|nr:hypothetical protein [Pirellulales bacterium]